MKIINTNWGKKVIIPETKNNSEFEYDLRNVRKINDDCQEEQALINELEQKERKAERKLMLLAWSLENTIKHMDSCHDYQTWEDHNKADFNEYYHDQLQLLENDVNACSFEYAERSGHGWCL